MLHRVSRLHPQALRAAHASLSPLPLRAEYAAWLLLTALAMGALLLSLWRARLDDESGGAR